MQIRTLGNGLTVSALGLGTMGMTMAYGASDEASSRAAIQHAHDRGVRLFDTAEFYNGPDGSNERLLGEAVRPFRDDIVLATKFGYDTTNDQSAGAVLDSRPERIRIVVENSLRYLGTDRIDVLYQHRVDPDIPIEDVAGAVGDLVAAGKVVHFGLSEAGPDLIRRANGVHPVSVVQSEYSVFEREVEAVLPTLRELGIGLVAYSPLGRGFLTGHPRPAAEYEDGDMRRFDPRWQPGNYERNAAAVDQLAGVAETAGVTVTQLALAWVLMQGADVVPIFGTRTPSRVDENVAAADVVLDKAIRQQVTDLLPEGAFGSRYTEGHVPSWANAPQR